MIFLLRFETLWEIPNSILGICMLISFICISLHILINIKRYKIDEFPFFLLFLVVSFISGYNSGASFQLVMTALLVIGAKDMSMNHIIKFHFITGLLFCTYVIAGSLRGSIDNEIIISDRSNIGFGVSDSIPRFCFGYTWPTDLATHVLFLLLSYWVIRKGRLMIIECTAYVLLAGWILFFMNARLATLFILFIIILNFLIRNGIDLSKKNAFILKNGVLFFSIISVLLQLYYDKHNKFYQIIDDVMSNRLSITNYAMNSVGTSLWGQEYKMYAGIEAGIFYNYIDSSYLQLYIIYGLIYFIFIILLYRKLCIKCYKDDNIVMLLAIFLASATGIIAQHFIQFFMNPFLLGLMSKKD